MSMKSVGSKTICRQVTRISDERCSDPMQDGRLMQDKTYPVSRHMTNSLIFGFLKINKRDFHSFSILLEDRLPFFVGVLVDLASNILKIEIFWIQARILVTLGFFFCVKHWWLNTHPMTLDFLTLTKIERNVDPVWWILCLGHNKSWWFIAQSSCGTHEMGSWTSFTSRCGVCSMGQSCLVYKMLFPWLERSCLSTVLQWFLLKCCIILYFRKVNGFSFMIAVMFHVQQEAECDEG